MSPTATSGTSRSRRILAALGMVALLGCSSPEAARVRGDGRGADVGNRRGEVELHAGSSIYYRTPTQRRGIGRTDVASGARPAG
jgi:hypothetical protein